MYMCVYTCLARGKMRRARLQVACCVTLCVDMDLCVGGRDYGVTADEADATSVCVLEQMYTERKQGREKA